MNLFCFLKFLSDNLGGFAYFQMPEGQQRHLAPLEGSPVQDSQFAMIMKYEIKTKYIFTLKKIISAGRAAGHGGCEV